MNNLISKENVVYYIEKEDVQFEAKERIGRELKDEEFTIIRKLLDNGISINMDITQLSDLSSMYNFISFQHVM